MSGYIGCAGLILIVLFIIFLAFRTRKIYRDVGELYKKYELASVSSVPQHVREAIGAQDPICLQGELTLASGDVVPYYWWEWFVRSMTVGGGAAHGSITSFFAISFPPNTVSMEFEQLTFAARKGGFLLSFKNAFGFRTQTPIRVEKLNDGSLLIIWQIVRQVKHLEDTLAWLKYNVTIAPGRR